MRVILYTGKGGVGKTSVAAATAIKLADEGKRVLIMSTDQAHSLSDSLGIPLGYQPIQVIENLEAMEVDVVAQSEAAWGNLKDFMKNLLTSRVEGGIEAEELLVFPGLEELFSLFTILEYYEKGAYDVLIVDCAPTGETLSLLKYPEMFGLLIEKLLPAKRKMAKIAGPFVQKVTKIPMPGDGVFDDVERLMDHLERLQTLMLDKTVVSLRLVSTPEKIVVTETQRNYTWLQLYNYNVDAVIVNKVYPDEALKGYFNQWVKLQAEGLKILNESFPEVPIFKLELQPHELKSVPVLREIGTLYESFDPAAVLSLKESFKLSTRDNVHILEIALPFANKTDLDLGQIDGQLHIAVQNEKRCFQLPKVLVNLNIQSAKFEDGILVIEFQ